MEKEKLATGAGHETDHAGGYFVMVDYEKSAGHYASLAEARDEGQKLCDAEPLPCVFTIEDADGVEIEPISRSDGKDLAAQVAGFAKLHGGA